MVKLRFTEEIIYSFVCKHPGLCTYEISKKLSMTGGRVRYALLKLENVGLIKFKFDRKNPRIKKLCYPVDAWNLLPRNLKKELKSVQIKLRA